MKSFVAAAFIAALISFVYLDPSLADRKVYPLGLEHSYADSAQRAILPSGLTLLIKESRKNSLVAIEARVKTGSATEEGYLGSGISHFVEHMLFKGTQKWPNPGDIEQKVKSLGGYINGFTAHDFSGYQIIVPSEYLTDGLEIFKEILTKPLFDPPEMEKEREVILKEIKLNRDAPSRYLSLLLWSNMFKIHNYGFPVIGCEPLFKKLTREDLAAYHKKFYIPDNIILGIAGDVDSAAASKKVTELFGDIERSFPLQVYIQQEPPQITEAEVTEDREISVSYLAIGFHSVGIRDKDLFALDVLSIILGGGEDSRLFKTLYRKRGLVYSVGSFNYTPKDPGAFVIEAVLNKKDIQSVIDEVRRQIEEIKTRPITDKELKKAKNQVLSAYIFSRQTIQDEVNDLVSGEALVGDYDFSRKYVEGIKFVTKEMAAQAAAKYLRMENATIIKLVPKEPKPKLKISEATAVQIEKFELPNRLKVLILEDRGLPIFSINAVGLGGLRTENFTTNGISNLVSQTLLCGTKKRSEDEISSQIEGAGAAINTFSASSAFGIAGNCLAKDAGLFMEIFSDSLQDPVFQTEKIEREKSVIKAGIKSISDDIYRSGMRTLKYVLFKKHPYRFQAAGRVSTIDKFTQQDINAYYKTYYRPNNMVLAISGDIDKNKIREKLSGLFARFEEGPSVKINPPKERKLTRPKIVRRSMEKEQSLILLGFGGTSIYNHDSYVLEVLSSILSGINGRLSQKVREEKGLAYALGAKSVAGIERGIIIFYIGTSKENLELAEEELFSEIERLKKEGIRDSELSSAKKELIGMHRIGLQRSQDVARQAAVDEVCGLGYDNFLKYEDRIRHITKECVLRAAKKYLNLNSYALVIIKGTKERGSV